MEVKYCKKCHLKKRDQNFDKTIAEIKEIAGVSSIDENCFSCCGLGKKNFILGYDDELIMCENYEKLKNVLGEKSVNS